ncbi:sigma-70 family RNA polymerase sigma factor [Flavihumibacter petaseus]|uniref:Putative RNA polymerase ECF-type sigma factor n=1 Tax=Flavihumibacter petaseus NBRC 106054 TaxID=1220578 RepID=A0A0E9N3V6_9BACT|nr:sigma-70 family RNA polymerase sigma factor [Flavihumibacter petaseus]GAO44045.1 putative RNA polymerase ECF-type sigma factor [Flavihumibacter petaseus NBRC 106054]
MKHSNVIAVRNGSHEAYFQVFNDYHARLYQYIHKFTGSAWLAEEAVQLTFIKLWEKRESLSEEYSMSTQLFRMSKCIVIDLLRKEKLRQTQELQDIFAMENSISDRLVQKDELVHTLSVIRNLPHQSRRVFELSRIENLSHKEISHMLSISPKTIENHITKAVKFIRQSLSIFF